MRLKPFVKWVGGKSKVVDEIFDRLPQDRFCSKYCEPFVGGGAFLIALLQEYSFEEVLAIDLNRELIISYEMIRDYVDELVAQLSELQQIYWSAGEKEQVEIYYKKRDLYNSFVGKELSHEDRLSVAVLFIFLNKTCFNGLYRVNKSGYFNVAIGSYEYPLICDRENLIGLSELFAPVTFKVGQFYEAGQFVDKQTFTYLDPPYIPLTATANFTSYTKEGFGMDEFYDLVEFLEEMDKRRYYFLCSNSDTKNVSESCEFLDETFQDFTVDRVCVGRSVNSDAVGRGKVSEIMIYNYTLE